MKYIILDLCIMLTLSLNSQVEYGFLVIENKGKSKCFFDDSHPHARFNTGYPFTEK
jgi:hypothetical protein